MVGERFADGGLVAKDIHGLGDDWVLDAAAPSLWGYRGELARMKGSMIELRAMDRGRMIGKLLETDGIAVKIAPRIGGKLKEPRLIFLQSIQEIRPLGDEEGDDE